MILRRAASFTSILAPPNLVQTRAAVCFRIADSEQTEVTPFAKDLGRKGFGLFRLLHKRGDFGLTEPPNEIAKLDTFVRQTEIHGLFCSAPPSVKGGAPPAGPSRESGIMFRLPESTIPSGGIAATHA